jgi:hydrogenase maturation protease
VGERIAGDDGVGPAVIDRLRGEPLPADVGLVELSDPSALVPLLDETHGRLVVVDAVLAEPPGEVRALDLAALETAALTPVSSHGLSVGQALALAAATRAPAAASPEVRVVAINIGRPTRGLPGLSPAVAASVPRAARVALALATVGFSESCSCRPHLAPHGDASSRRRC